MLEVAAPVIPKGLRRIDALQKDSDAKEVVIHGLQKDIERMSKGCGAGGCTWTRR